MNIEKKIDAFNSLGERLRYISSGHINAVEEEVISKAAVANQWFTMDNIFCALSALGNALSKEQIKKWVAPYLAIIDLPKKKNIIGVINAGNIPAVGFHDFFCVLMSGNIYHGKNSVDDAHLLPFIASLLKTIEPGFKENIFFVERILSPNAVIATGSNNSARYFEYYFGKYPHIIRKNRNGIAVLDGNENTEELSGLADDVFQYFGLGCRNVSKIFLPDGYDIHKLFSAFEKYNHVTQHHRYMNNYNYQRVVFLMQKKIFLENDFIILKEEDSLHSPIAVLHYAFYKKAEEVFENLSTKLDEIQCVSHGNKLFSRFNTENLSLVQFGQTQNPNLWDYADGVDTMEFLLNINK